MSRAFIAEVIKDSAAITQTSARQAANDLMEAIASELKKVGKFTLPGFGTFTVRDTKARQGLNPRTGEPVQVKAGKTVRFKASKNLKEAV
jgi:DNA-binding protein HU-beta